MSQTQTAAAPTKALTSTDDKGTKPSKYNSAGFKACQGIVLKDGKVESIEKTLEEARLIVKSSRQSAMKDFIALPDDKARQDYIAGAVQFKDSLIASGPQRGKKTAENFISELRKVWHNLVQDAAKVSALFNGEGTYEEKMGQLESRIARKTSAEVAAKKEAAATTDAKPDAIASAPIVSDKAPKKHQQSPELSDRDIIEFIGKLHKAQLPLALLHFAQRAKEVGDADMHQGLMNLSDRLATM